jgi:hypothetical protein
MQIALVGAAGAVALATIGIAALLRRDRAAIVRGQDVVAEHCARTADGHQLSRS